MSKKRKILIAVGGTGGHLFPAEALARDLLAKNREIELLFAGAGLSTNRYFHKEQFPHEDVASATPFRGNLFSSGKAIIRGLKSALSLLKRFEPDLIIGFGSFHSFPLIAAALLKRVPFMLFEPNAFPGKVNRLFSRWAKTTAIQFPHAKRSLSGVASEVKMPIKAASFDKEEARAHFGLEKEKATVLVFGGSQGSHAINQAFCKACSHISQPFQVIHITGYQEDLERIRKGYADAGVTACVKPFEEKISYALKAADFAVCRAGAATVAELIAYELPSILIPFRAAADDHQRINAQVMEKEIQGAKVLLESELTPEHLAKLVQELLSHQQQEMREAIHRFKKREEKTELCELVLGKL